MSFICCNSNTRFNEQLKKKIYQFTIFLFYVLIPTSVHANYNVYIDAPSFLQEVLQKHLDLVRYQNFNNLTEEQIQFLLDTVDDEVSKLAATEGYFWTKTLISFKKNNNYISNKQIHLHVNTGPQTIIKTVNIHTIGEVLQEETGHVDMIYRSWTLPIGTRFRQADWSNAKNQGLIQLRNYRYAAAHIVQSQVRINPSTQQASLSVLYNSGPSFTLGPLKIIGLQHYPENIICNMNSLTAGTPYDIHYLLSLQRKIQSTAYFSNVIVNIDRDPTRANMAPIQVLVTEFPIQRIRGGIGYITDTGGQIEGRYTYYNTFNKAWIFDSELRLEQQRQFTKISLTMPPNKKSFISSLNTSIEYTALEGVRLNNFYMGLKHTNNNEFYSITYKLNYFRDQIQQKNLISLPFNIVIIRGIHQALVLSFTCSYRNVDNQIFPRQGNLFTLDSGLSIRGLISDQTFARFYSSFKQYIPFAKQDLIIMRIEFGSLFTQKYIIGVPTSLLFLAGGNESIRGYNFASLGNTQNNVVFPTKYLFTSSFEYQRWFTKQWGIALFYDLGSATNSWTKKNIYTGIGVGIRWRTPIGSLSVDLAYGIQKCQLHPNLSLGISF